MRKFLSACVVFHLVAIATLISAAPAPVASPPSPVKASATVKPKGSRFDIDQHIDGKGAYVVLRDSRSRKVVSIVADQWLPHVAFYDSFNTGDYPRIAISSQGLQILDQHGKIRWIDIDELAKLDSGKPYTPRK